MRTAFHVTFRLFEILIVPVLLVCGVVLAVVVVYRAHSWVSMAGHMSDTMQRVQVENESFRTLTQLFGGAFVLAGLYFSGKTIVLSRLAQSSERLAMALEGLGSDVEARRVGAIAVLGSFLDRSSAEYDTALSTLCAFVRSTTASDQYRLGWANQPSVDVQSAVEALSYRRRRSWRPVTRRELNLRGSYLAGCDFREADLAGADFRLAVLTEANFYRAVLREAKFTEAVAERASFVQADLREATFYRASAPEARYREAILTDVIFTRVDLSNASFAGTVLKRTSFSGAVLSGTSFNRAWLTECDFVNANDDDADFTDAVRRRGRL
ncbi:pentapeptide repeat-containing protein [Dactylosporangium sp. NBC_01737]|uniref:pentapeptide repeat-containing protein n=1 Tax=Dactylosporangium sp. NBC_01737 TaxID=2975959 RepID=UPI002E110C60|nr:pentapeptide repeat-containing protein [Dactylosporangium sp. NBC_01737]